MIDFWENNFKEKQTMWGFEPAESPIIVKNFFIKEKVNEILIAGIGYGRNVHHNKYVIFKYISCKKVRTPF